MSLDDPDFGRTIITDLDARAHHSWYIDGSNFAIYVSDLDSITLPALTESQQSERKRFIERLSLGETPLRMRPFLQIQVADGATAPTLAGERTNVPLLSALRAQGVTVARCRICWPSFSNRAWLRCLNRELAAGGKPPIVLPSWGA
jgi:hypothetical protein